MGGFSWRQLAKLPPICAIGAALICCPASSDEDVQPLLMEVRLQRQVISEVMPGWQRGEHVFLPLGELCRELEFSVSVWPDEGRSAGWFLAENRTFSFDSGKGEVRIQGELTCFEANLILVEPDDIYVDTSLLSCWFPIDLKLDFRNLILTVISREPLPMEQKLLREARRVQVLQSQRIRKQVNYPPVENPYRWITWPAFDVALKSEFLQNPEPHKTVSYNSFVTAEVLKLSTNLFITGSGDQTISETRISAGRTDPESALLGPMRATEFSLGDVFSPHSSLVTRSRKGRGVVLSSFPRNRPVEFDRTTIHGEGKPGWEAELYRNGALINFQVVPVDGVFEFQDVPVLYGQNKFLVLLYGPQGQIREVEYQYCAGPEQIQPGKGFYRVALNQKDVDLIPVDSDKRHGEIRIYAEYDRGLCEKLSTGFSLISMALDRGAESKRHTYCGVNLHSSLANIYTVLDAEIDVTGGWGSQLALQRSYDGINLMGEFGWFHHYESERITNGDALLRKFRLRVDGHRNYLIPISYKLEGKRERRQSGRYETDIRSRLSLSTRKAQVTNELNWWSSAGAAMPVNNRMTGQALLNTRLIDLSVRFAVNYMMSPITQAQSVVLSTNRQAQNLGRWTLGIAGTLIGNEVISYSLGWNRAMRGLTLGLNGSWASDRTATVGLSLSFCLGRNPLSGDWGVLDKSMTSAGMAIARVVLDQDGDGLAGDTDPPISNARFKINSTRVNRFKTNADGEALITDLRAFQTANIAVNSDSFDEPFWIVKQKGFSFLPRPGVTTCLTYVVQEAGEIDGTVYIKDSDAVHVAKGIPLQLVDSAGAVIMETVSAYDGFYMFDLVPYGSYCVRLHSTHTGRLGLGLLKQQQLIIDALNPVRSGLSILCVPQP